MKHLILAFLLLSAASSIAQTSNILGNVKSVQGVAISNANIILYKTSDSSVSQLELSDTDGNFAISNVPTGNYWLVCSALGYSADTNKTVIVGTENRRLAPIALAKQSKLVGELRATGKKQVIEVKPGKTIVNVEASINNTGSNALDILRKSPGVTVDNNDNLSIKGKSGVIVYIDGKQSYLDSEALAQMLRSTNSSNIASIEIISNPGSKYDAEGNAGIINIKLKKNVKLGTNGTVTAGFSYGFTPKYNASISINNNNSKTNLFATYGIDGGDQYNFQNFLRRQSGIQYDQNAKNHSNNLSHTFKAGADYRINSKNTVGIMANGNYVDGRWTNDGLTNIGQIAAAPTQRLVATNTINSTALNINGNINYRFADTNGRVLSIDLDAGNYNATSQSTQPNEYRTLQDSLLSRLVFTNSAPVNIDIYTAKFDYEANKFKGKIGYGAKASWVNTDNDFKFYNLLGSTAVIDPARTNHFTYIENVYAAYANYTRQLSKKLGSEFGLRAEQTTSKGTLETLAGNLGDTVVSRQYLNLFPTLGLSYQVNQKHAFTFSFSRRIQRPNYQQLNPFENKLDELTYEKGNAFLRPQYAYNFELGHTFLGFVSTSISYSRLTDVYAQITDTAAGARAYIINRNMANSNVWGVTFGMPLQFKKWWTGYFNINGNYTQTSANFNGNPINIAYPSMSLYCEQNFQLKKEYMLSASGWYAVPGYWGGTFRTKPIGAMDLGISKNFLKKKLNARLALTDIFWSSRWAGISDYAGLYFDASGGNESRLARLTLSYRFGSNTVQQSRSRKTGLSDEADRIRKGK
jgi:iron complex outermembrane recepter protein